MSYKPRPLTETEGQKAIELLEQGTKKKDIGNILKVNYNSLRRYFESQNVPSRKPAIAPQHQEEIIALYLQGNTCEQLQKNYFSQYTSDQLNYFLRKQGVTRKNGTQTVLNHNYFHEITTQEQAYWLGLLTADGCVQNPKGQSWSISLSLQDSDSYLIDKWGQAIESNKSVKRYTNNGGFQRQDGSPHVEARLVVHSQTMAQDLINLGVVPHKSHDLKIFPDISKELRRHYIRGYFDGNGSATFYKSKRGIRIPRVIFYGTFEYLCRLQNILIEDLQFTRRKITTQKHEDVSLFSYGTIQDIKKFYDYLYNDATVYMFRKKEKIEHYLDNTEINSQVKI